MIPLLCPLLQFMIDREGEENGLNSHFWETRKFCDSNFQATAQQPLQLSASVGDVYYYSPALGELRIGSDRPPVVRGGLLCDEMGMGKTLVVTALVVHSIAEQQQWQQSVPANGSTPASASAQPWQNRKGSGKSPRASGNAIKIPTCTRGGTLIIAPGALVAQWKREIAKSLTADNLAVVTHEHGDVVRCNDSAAALELHVRALTNADIVITSYSTLVAMQKQKSWLLKLFVGHSEWYRVCLDEMQEVRSQNSIVSKICASIEGERRWMISGTPLFTSIDDLHGELAFLKVPINFIRLFYLLVKFHRAGRPNPL